MAAPRPGIAVQRQKILDAARVLLQTRSMEELTAKDLAAGAGVSRATFYRAFATVDAVIEALHASYAEHVSGRLSGFIASGDEDWFQGIIDAVLTDAIDQRIVLVAMFREEIRPGSAAKKHRDQRIERQVRLIAGWWSERTGVAPDEDIIRVFALLLQVAGLHVALHPDMSHDARASLAKALRYTLDATVQTYLREHGQTAL